MIAALFTFGAVLALTLACWLALDFVYQTTMSHGQDVVSQSVTVSTDADGKIYSEFTVGASSTVNWVGLTGLASLIKAYSFLPTFAGTMTVNYASGSDDVITLTANQPIAWNNLSGLSSHFTNVNAITSIDFANSGASGTIKIMVAKDVTT